jgi:hypothetical protein
VAASITCSPVVQDQQGIGGFEPLEQRLLPARDVERRDHGVDDVVRRDGCLEPRQPDAVEPDRIRAIERAADGDRHRRLADAGRPDDLDQPIAAEPVNEGGHVLLAADQVRRHRRQVPGPQRRGGCRGRGRHAERAGLDQDLLLEVA